MAELRSRRKLAAILSADVVGYSHLMAANEAATVETLKSYRDVIARLVVRRGGRVVNAPGDALLAEFPSAVEAVQAAIEIQKSLEGHNNELEPQRRMKFRIGVNLGDVIEEADGTIYGDGVNIAARLEKLAEPCGICIGHNIYDRGRQGRGGGGGKDDRHGHRCGRRGDHDLFARRRMPAHLCGLSSGRTCRASASPSK